MLDNSIFMNIFIVIRGVIWTNEKVGKVNEMVSIWLINNSDNFAEMFLEIWLKDKRDKTYDSTEDEFSDLSNKNYDTAKVSNLFTELRVVLDKIYDFKKRNICFL